MTLSKVQAIEALKEGKKVTHEKLGKGENATRYLSKDGSVITNTPTLISTSLETYERNLEDIPYLDDGWSIYEEPAEERMYTRNEVINILQEFSDARGLYQLYTHAENREWFNKNCPK